jgi:hypothetical protein
VWLKKLENRSPISGVADAIARKVRKAEQGILNAISRQKSAKPKGCTNYAITQCIHTHIRQSHSPFQSIDLITNLP